MKAFLIKKMNKKIILKPQCANLFKTSETNSDGSRYNV